MGTDRGLQAVPRGLDRNLTTYLQALHTEMLRLSGLVRGSENVRAVRASEAVAFRVGGGTPSSSGIDVGAIASQILRDGAVTERKLADRAVANRKLADNAVDSRVLAPGAAGNTALAEGSVTSGKLATSAVTTEKIVNGAVTADKLMGGAVTTAKLADAAVTANTIGTGVVSADKLASGSVGTEALRDGAITLDKLAPGVLPVMPEIPEIPVLPVWVTGTASDGETVVMPGSWDTQPTVFLSAFSCVLPEPEPPLPEPPLPELVLPESGTVAEQQRLVVGPEPLTEILHEDGTGTGIWTFVAHGDFVWIAMGNEKSSL